MKNKTNKPKNKTNAAIPEAVGLSGWLYSLLKTFAISFMFCFGFTFYPIKHNFKLLFSNVLCNDIITNITAKGIRWFKHNIIIICSFKFHLMGFTKRFRVNFACGFIDIPFKQIIFEEIIWF